MPQRWRKKQSLWWRASDGTFKNQHHWKAPLKGERSSHLSIPREVTPFSSTNTQDYLFMFVKVSESGRPRILNTHAQRPDGARPFTLSFPTARRHHFQLDQGVLPPRKDRLHTFVYLFSEEQKKRVSCMEMCVGPFFPIYHDSLPSQSSRSLSSPFIHPPDYVLYQITISVAFRFRQVIGLLVYLKAIRFY